MSSHNYQALDEMKQNRGQLQKQYEELKAELALQQEAVEKEEKKVQDAEARSQEICDKTKRLERQGDKLDSLTKVLTAGNKVKGILSSTILDQQSRMNMTIKEQYAEMKVFQNVLNDLPAKQDFSAGTENLLESAQDELVDIARQVKAALRKALEKSGKGNQSKEAPAAASSRTTNGTRGRRPGRPANATPKRKRDSSSGSATGTRTTPVRSARNRPRYQESDEEEAAMSSDD